MNETLALLHAPLGTPGSGRVRYGAAMALWTEGLLTDEALEIYRTAAAHDERDPLLVLADSGLPPPPRPALATPAKALYEASRDYLLDLEHPGAADVRTSLFADPGEEHTITPCSNHPIEAWLTAALAALSAGKPALAHAVATAAPHLRWTAHDVYPRGEIGEAFASGHAYAALRGRDAPFAAHDFELGLFLIAPNTVYRDHQHNWPELCVPLTGPHGWRFGPGRPLIIKQAGEPVWNSPMQTQLTLSGTVPFLSLFVRLRNAREATRVIPSDDWTILEATRIA